MHSYYKYQNIKSNNEYEMLLKDKILSGQPNKVIEIPIFRNCEFDIERLVRNFEEIISIMYEKETTIRVEEDSLKSSLYYYLQESHSSYLAPAYNYNCYINLLIDLNINNMNGEKKEELVFVNYYYTIIIQNVLISIKALLDRVVPILSFFEKGISLTSTFGHISLDASKSKGLMSHVNKYKNSNKLLQFIYDEYTSWIKEVVKPRDTIMHYNDLKSCTKYTADGREFPMHYNIKLFGQLDEERNLDWDDGFYYKSLMKNVQDVYYFFDMLMQQLSNYNIKYSKEHFKDSKDYEKYLNLQ